jgi:iron complex transport system substrate-binding protein
VRQRRRTALIVWTVAAFVFLEASQPTDVPARIVSLIPAVTEMIFALGAGQRVVGVSSFDRFPPEVERIQNVGALLDPDLERILSLKPDLVIVYHSQADLRKQLERAKVPVYVYTHAGLADVIATIRAIGNRLGLADRGAKLAGDIDARINRIRVASGQGPRPLTLIVMGRENVALRGIYASGGVGFVHDMVTAAGGINVFADVKREAVQATTELILARRPEVIIELRADPLSAEAEQRELSVWRQLPSVPAVARGRVHIIVDLRTVIPGPRVVEGIEVIAAAIRSRQ